MTRERRFEPRGCLSHMLSMAIEVCGAAANGQARARNQMYAVVGARVALAERCGGWEGSGRARTRRPFGLVRSTLNDRAQSPSSNTHLTSALVRDNDSRQMSATTSFVTASAHHSHPPSARTDAETADDEEVDQLDSDLHSGQPLQAPAAVKRARKRKVTGASGADVSKGGREGGRQSAKRGGGSRGGRGRGRGRGRARGGGGGAPTVARAQDKVEPEDGQVSVQPIKGDSLASLSRFAYDPAAVHPPTPGPDPIDQLRFSPPHPTRTRLSSRPPSPSRSTDTNQPSASDPPQPAQPFRIKLEPSHTFIMPDFDEDGEPIYPSSAFVQPDLSSDQLVTGDNIGGVELTRLSQEGLEPDGPWSDEMCTQNPIMNSLIGQSGALNNEDAEMCEDESVELGILGALGSTPGGMFSPPRGRHSSPVGTSPGPCAEPSMGPAADNWLLRPELGDDEGIDGGSLAEPATADSWEKVVGKE